MSGLWCTALGFGNERLAEAARPTNSHPFLLPWIQSEKSHATNRTCRALTRPGTRADVQGIFANSGSEANDTAFKLIWYRSNAMGNPEKKKIIGRVKGYHGVTIAAASATGTPINHQAFDLPIDGFLHTDCPHYASTATPGESEEQYSERCAKNLDAHHRTGSARKTWRRPFIAEPLKGAGGVWIPPAGEVKEIQAVPQ